MTKQDFFKFLLNDFFEERTCSIKDLTNTIEMIMPVFGSIDVKVEEKEYGEKSVTFIDKDESMAVIAPKGVEIPDEMLDMSTTILRLTVDKENKITIVEHGLNIFTPANKEIGVFQLSLIGKKIKF